MENFVLNGNGQIDINRKGMGNGYTFHLQEINHNTEMCSTKDACDDTATSLSSYSNYKQRIDAMFDDSRSVLSDASRSDRRRKLPTVRGEAPERVLANNIQEKIEKMFEEISINGLQRRNSNARRAGPKDEKSPISRHDFAVTYLGSMPLLDKNVSLTSLQDPLKELYFEYKRNPPEDRGNVLTISKEGLKIKISHEEKLNAFPTIAVWASVKLSLRATPTAREYAFLPLVTDPDGVDKNLLFRELKQEDSRKIDDDNQSPIFAVVMKNADANRQLECHAFVCRSSEEAIVIAANLYQALMKKLKRKKEHKEQKAKESNGGIVGVPEPKPKVKVKKPAPPVPERVPKKAESDCEKIQEEETAPKSEVATEDPNSEKDEKVGRISQRRGSVPVNAHEERPRTLRRTVSDRGGNGITVKSHNEGGDILTKVAIPRSRSFLNANGPHSRYSGRNKANPKNETVSPLGLKELFNEFRLHEGLESMDDILNAIIDAEGMSFNDLKPIYKEFLLKLAVTLTKDELYQRSKTIMRRQKKRNRNCSFRKRAFMSSIGLNKLFRKTTTRLGKGKSPRPTNLEFTSIVFQSTTKQFDSNLPNIKKRQPNSFRVKRKQSSRRRLSKRLEKVKNKNISTTSEDSDFFQARRNANDSGGGANRASSGYFSCSECSCDSEKCTCTRTDKCYCTLGHKKSYGASSSDESRFNPKKKWSFRPEEPEDSLKSCSCDTESCFDGGKCYCNRNKSKRLYDTKSHHLPGARGVCQTPHLHQREKARSGSFRNHVRKRGETIFDQLKEQGFAASESTLSRAASPVAALRPGEKTLKQKTRLKPAASLEFLHVRPEHHSSECFRPSRGHPNFQEHLLKEIQNTSHRRSYFEDARRSCVRGSDVGTRHPPPFACGRRQYSSMRCRSDFLEDVADLRPFQRSVSYRTRNLFNSVRSKHSCDSIMNHIKFPDCANSSLRFTRRMDVYNSFSENRRFNRGDDLFSHSNYKENRRVQDRGLLSDDSDVFRLNGGNLQRLDYNLFTNPKPEKSDPRVSKKKVLVVSARDPKGKVLYMGTSSRCESSLKNPKNYTENAANASEALAVKKSAEIAALFSDVTSKPKLILDYAKDQRHNNNRARSNSYRSTNLENTLGYLP